MMFNWEFYKKKRKEKKRKDMHDKRYRVWKHCPKKRRVYMQIVIF